MKKVIGINSETTKKSSVVAKLCNKEKLFLDNVNDDVKKMFREACFAEWNGEWVPVLVLSPFDITERNIQDQWYENYETFLNSTKGTKIKHLVLWYGFENVPEKYGFVDKFKTYEEAKNEGLHIFRPSNAVNQLTSNDQRVLDGFIKISEAIKIRPSDRFIRTKIMSSGKAKRDLENIDVFNRGSDSNKKTTSETHNVKGALNVYTVEKEQAEFHLNEKNILPTMHKLRDAVSQKEKEGMFSLLNEIESAVPGIAPSFIELYDIGMFLKRTKQSFVDAELIAKVKAITEAMKMLYLEKRSRRPKDFKLTWKACDTILKQVEIKSSKVSSKVVASPELAAKSRKKSFSVRSMIDCSLRNASSSVEAHARKEHITTLVVPPLLVSKRELPKWLTEALPENVLDPSADDNDRVIGKEFIDCIDADWPEEVLQQINFDSFVHHIEQAAYDWSQVDETQMSRRRNTSVLKYPNNYFMKIRDIVSGLSLGNHFDSKHYPKLLDELLKGKYATPMDLVKLPGIIFYESMKHNS
jgi:hypothetical protein